MNSFPASMTAGDQILYLDTTITDRGSGIRQAGPSGLGDAARSGRGPFADNGGRDVNAEITNLEPYTYVIVNNEYVPIYNQCDWAAYQTGLSLNVTPYVGRRGVKLDIDVAWSDFVGFDASGSPITTSRQLSTTLHTPVGQENVIGGMRRQVRSSTTNKVPFLGSLPVLGWLFGRENQDTQSTEMVIVVRPDEIFNYELARNLPADDTLLMQQAGGTATIEETVIPMGFDMMLFDSERGTEATPFGADPEPFSDAPVAATE
jgi:type II/III secretion system protein